MRKSIILFLTFFLCVAAYAQNLTVSGTVTDKDTKEPLIGVNVLLKGTTIGTVTDFDGKYTLEVDDSKGTLQFSYIRLLMSRLTAVLLLMLRWLLILKHWKRLLLQQWVSSVSLRL